MNRFPIGFWNYTDLTVVDISCVKDWADAGMTLAMSPNFGDDEFEPMREILDASHEAGIKVILGFRDGHFHRLRTIGEEAFRSQFAKAAEALGAHPAVLGFHVGDEPNTDAFDAACTAMRIQKELAPHLQPFLNLLPWHEGCEPRVGYASWARYLDAFVAGARPDFLCYDCYSQMNPEQRGWNMYFRNLREFHEAAVRGGMDYWSTLLSVGHFHYRCPQEDDLRWQVNTAVAHGAKGLLWFFFYMRDPHDNYRVAPIDEHWERTEAFEWLSRVCRSFLKGPAATVQKLTLKGAMHFGHAWGGWPEFDGSGRVAAVSSATDIIISEFVHEDGGEYVMIVNNSQTENTHASITVVGDRPGLEQVGWLGKSKTLVDSTGRGATLGEDFIRTHAWLAPGQMELYRVVERR